MPFSAHKVFQVSVCDVNDIATLYEGKTEFQYVMDTVYRGIQCLFCKIQVAKWIHIYIQTTSQTRLNIYISGDACSYSISVMVCILR